MFPPTGRARYWSPTRALKACHSSLFPATSTFTWHKEPHLRRRYLFIMHVEAADHLSCFSMRTSAFGGADSPHRLLVFLRRHNRQPRAPSSPTVWKQSFLLDVRKDAHHWSTSAGELPRVLENQRSEFPLAHLTICAPLAGCLYRKAFWRLLVFIWMSWD